MTKKILLSAAAVAAVMAASPAFAGSISVRAGAATTATTSYALASQLNFGNGITSAAGQFDVLYRTNADLGAGTYTVVLTYSGATFAAGVSGATLSTGAGAPTCADGQAAGFVDATGGTGGQVTMALTNGGAVGGNTLTYTLQIPEGGRVRELCFAPALNVTGPVSVTAATINQVTTQPVDPSVIAPIITTRSGFTAVAAPANPGPRILAGTTAATRFRTLSSNSLGQLTFGPVANTYKDLIGTPVAQSDIVSMDLAVTGNLTGMTLTTSPATPVTQTASGATISASPAPTSPLTFNVAADPNSTAALQPSQFRVSGSLGLSSAFSGPFAITARNLAAVSTEGLSYIIPWVSSATQSAGTGSRTVVRISRVGTSGTGASTGNVYAQINNPLRGSAVNGTYALVGTMGASGEVVIDSSRFEQAFGDFGRADFRLVYTPSTGTGFTTPNGPGGNAPEAINNIIVKRVIAQPNGGVAEMDVVGVDGAVTVGGTVGLSDQTAAPVVGS